MADLGSIGLFRRAGQKRTLNVWAATNAMAAPKKANLRNLRRKQDTWRYGGREAIYRPNAGIIGGTVIENSLPVPYALVRVYYRVTGALVAGTRADANGVFLVDGLDPVDLNNYYAVALDPDGGVLYNALIFDRLTPVNTAAARTLLPSGHDSLIIQGPASADNANYDSLVAYDAPVMWLKLNDASGSVATDHSGNGINGTYTGIVYRQHVLRKESLGAARFDGNSDRVLVAANPIIQLNNYTNWSYEIWFRRMGSGGSVIQNLGGIYADEQGGDACWVLYMNPGGTQLIVSNSNGQTPLSAAIKPDTIYHAVVNRTGNNWALYLQGSVVSTGTNTIRKTNNNPFFIGGNAFPSSYGLNAQVGDVALYNYALSAAQIQAHFNKGIILYEALASGLDAFSAGSPSVA